MNALQRGLERYDSVSRLHAEDAVMLLGPENHFPMRCLPTPVPNVTQSLRLGQVSLAESQLLLIAFPLCNIPKGPNPSIIFAFAVDHGSRISVDHHSVLELNFVAAGFLGVCIEMVDLRHEGVRILDQRDHIFEHRTIFRFVNLLQVPAEILASTE